MKKVKKIDLASQLNQGYYAGESEIILYFPHYLLVRTEVVDILNKIEFAIFYLVSSSLSAVEIARGNSSSGIVWSISQDEIRKIFGLTANDIYIIECEINCYQESGELLSETILEEQKEADENYKGRCKIWVKYHYYDGTWNTPKDGYLTDDNGEVLEFESYKKAQEYVEDRCNVNVYYLKHGEYAKPEYIILKW